jgi:hypothetical protein
MDEADDNPPFQVPVIYLPRQSLMQALKFKDVYKPHNKNISVPRLELS